MGDLWEDPSTILAAGLSRERPNAPSPFPRICEYACGPLMHLRRGGGVEHIQFDTYRLWAKLTFVKKIYGICIYIYTCIILLYRL